MRLSCQGVVRKARLARRAASVRKAAGSQGGFTLIVALGVLLVTSMLLVAGFTAVDGDTHLAREDVSHKEAYYAALAGVQAYEYQLEKNPDFWQTCESLPVTGEPKVLEGTSRYSVELLPASSAPAGTEKCNPAKPFETAIESKGRQTNTFRIKSTGFAGKEQSSLVATFGVTGFLDFVYFTRFEEFDPSLDNASSVEKCSQELDEGRKAYEEEEERKHVTNPCGEPIVFGPEDSVRGPMHTDDTAAICGGPEFGRKTRLNEGNPDPVEIRGGTYSYGDCGGGAPVFNTTTGKPAVGEEAQVLVPPEEDTSLKAYVESGYEFVGATTLELQGTEVTVTNANYNSGKAKKIPLPKNGLIYVSSEASCAFVYKQEPADTAAEISKEAPCGTAYVKGNYNASLTIGAEQEIVIKGSITPTGITPPTGHCL